MDPTNIYLNPPSQQQQQSWPAQLASTPLNSAIQQPQTTGTAQVSPYLLQQQRTANFAGSTSTPSPYPSQTPTPQPVAATPTSSYYQYMSNGASTTTSSNGTTIPATFYTPYYSFNNSLNTGSLPISQYSSLSGATGQTPSSSATPSSTPTPVPAPQQQVQLQQHPVSQVHQPAPNQQPQHLQMGHPSGQVPTPSLSRNNSSQMTIDPSLVNPYSMFKLPQYPQNMQPTNTSANPSSSTYQLSTGYAPHQFMQSPMVISPSQLTRSTHGYSNALANRPIAQPQATQIPTPQPTVTPQNTEQSIIVGPSSVPNGGLSPIYKEILTPKTIDKTPETTANSIISLLTKSKWDDVNCATRVEILTKIRDNAGKEFYKVWAKNAGAMEVLRDWLKSTVTEEGWDDTLMPLLFIIDRLPLGVQDLQTSKIGRVLLKVVKDPPNGAVKDLASNIETKWRKLVTEASKSKEDEETRAKKRKLENLPPSKPGPPAKKPAIAPASANKPATTVVKKVVTAAAKDSKADSSFFSSKPKPKLPSFRKTAATTAVKSEEQDSGTAQPSSIDPFAEAVKALNKSGSPAIAAAEATAAAIASSLLRESTPTSSSATPVSLGKNGKPKKRVIFAPDDKLTLVKIIERAVYDDDAGEGAHHTSYRDLDIDEGHALHAHLFEEQVDWYEPPEIEFPAETIENLKRGTESTEVATQEARERSAMEAVYMSTAQVPMTPSDLHPGMDGPPDESQIVIMAAGPDLANLEQPPPPPATALQDLLAKIAVNPDDSHRRNGPNFGNFSLEGPSYQGYGQDMDTTWGEGDGYGDGNIAGSSGDPQGWNGQGLPPPSGPAGFNEAWEGPAAREPPTGPRRGTARGGYRGGYRGGFRGDDGWLPREQIPCKFYNGPAGCIKGQDCPFRH